MGDTSMFCKQLLIGLFVATALNLSLAQNALTAEPAQYKLVFENEFVRVINIHFGAHEKSGMYSHPAGVIVAITAGHMKFVDDHGKTKISSYLPGDTRWVPPVRHTGENLDDGAYNAIFIEIKSDGKMGSDRPAGVKSGIPVLDAQTRQAISQALFSLGSSGFGSSATESITNK